MVCCLEERQTNPESMARAMAERSGLGMLAPG